MQGASQFLMHILINQLLLNLDGLCICKQPKGYKFAEKFVLQCKQLTKFQVKKRFDRPTRLLPEFGCCFFFNMHMYNEFYVLDVLIVLLYM